MDVDPRAKGRAMTKRPATRSIVAALAVALLASACANEGSKPAGSSKPSPRATQASQNETQPIKNQPLTVIPHVGKLAWSCEGSKPVNYSIKLKAGKTTATDEVVWEHSTPSASVPNDTLQPGHALTYTGPAYQSLEIRQATEPRTLLVQVSIHFRGCHGTQPVVHKAVKTKKNF
jgi:hypothetical protein